MIRSCSQHARNTGLRLHYKHVSAHFWLFAQMMRSWPITFLTTNKPYIHISLISQLSSIIWPLQAWGGDTWLQLLQVSIYSSCYITGERNSLGRKRHLPCSSYVSSETPMIEERHCDWMEKRSMPFLSPRAHSLFGSFGTWLPTEGHVCYSVTMKCQWNSVTCSNDR